MKSFFAWLRLRFLPEWARRQLMEENSRLTRELDEARREIDRLESYIEGMQDGLRRQRKIIINSKGGGEKA